jgi:hypothetical protein
MKGQPSKETVLMPAPKFAGGDQLEKLIAFPIPVASSAIPDDNPNVSNPFTSTFTFRLPSCEVAFR